MYKLLITVIDSREDGTAVVLFEDYQKNYFNQDSIANDDKLGEAIAEKVRAVEKINNQVTSPF